jgi:hypothetical protein
MMKNYVFSWGLSWSWSYSSWVYSSTYAITTNVVSSNHAHGEFLLNTTLCDKVFQWLAAAGLDINVCPIGSLKRFWDCDFNFANVLELHHSMENDKWYNKKNFNLAFHFSFNQNKLWTNRRSNRALLYNKPSLQESLPNEHVKIIGYQFGAEGYT